MFGDTVTVSGNALPSASLHIVRRDKILEIDIERAWEKTHTAEDWDGGIVFEFAIH